ncbi:21296_t:CDS:2, partial [Racocetra persica]
VVLIQTVPVSFSNDTYILTSSDLLYSSPLLLFSAPVVQSSYHPDNEGGRESFMLTRRLYNGITNNKHVPSNVIISYVNENNHYNAIPHIVASDIEWTYSNNESQSSSTSGKEKSRSYEELDNQLDSIEEKYATLSSQPSQKKSKLSLHSPTARKSNDILTTVNFTNIISQVRLNQHPPKFNNINPIPENTQYDNSPNTNTNTISPLHTRREIDITPVDNNKPVATASTDPSLSPDKNAKQTRKNLRPLYL